MSFKSLKKSISVFAKLCLFVGFYTGLTTFAFGQNADILQNKLEQALTQALMQLSDLSGNYNFDNPRTIYAKNEKNIVTVSCISNGKKPFTYVYDKMTLTEHDVIIVSTSASHFDYDLRAVKKMSAADFRASRLGVQAQGYKFKPYKKLPGGVIDENQQRNDNGNFHAMVRIQFWKSQECNGIASINYIVPYSESYKNTTPSYDERVATAKSFCRAQTERLAELIYTRLPEGTGSIALESQDDGSTSTPAELQTMDEESSDVAVSDTDEPLTPEAALLAVAGGSMVMALGALLQLWGMGGLQNVSDIRSAIANLLNTDTASINVTELESSLQELPDREPFPDSSPAAPELPPNPINGPIPLGYEFQGKIWYQPPWEKGGPYWMNKSDYEAMRAMMRQGKVWSDRWGWVTTEDMRDMETQRATAWNHYKFHTDDDIQKLNEQIKVSQAKLAETRNKLAEMEEIERLRERLNELEKQRVLDNSFASQLSETWKNYEAGINRDLDALPGDLARLTLIAAREIRDTTGAIITATGATFSDIYNELTDVNNYKAIGQAAVDTAKDLILHPIDSSVKVGDKVKEAGSGAIKVAGTAGSVAIAIASNPVGLAEAVLGIDNWRLALDPDVPVGERVVRALYGAIDASMNFGTGGAKKAIEGMEAGIDGVRAIKGSEAAADAAKVTAKLDDAARLKAWEAGRAAGKQKVDKFADAIKSGNEMEIKKALVECQRDKHAIQSINKGDDALKMAYNDKMKQLITNDVDKAVKEKIAQRYGLDVKDVEIIKPTNPSVKPKVGSDVDFTIRVKAKPGEIVADPNNPGKFIKVQPGDVVTKDVPVKEAQQIYNRELYAKVTGEPIPTDPKKLEVFQEQANKLAHDMDHVAGHRVGTESYGASQVDLEVILQKNGGRFTDPEQAGHLAAFKSNHLYAEAETIITADPNKAEALVAEGIRQTTKQYSTLIETRISALQGKGINASVDSRLTQAVDILKEVEKTGMAPAKAEAMLKAQLNMNKNDVANMLGNQVAKLHMIKG